MRHNQPGNSNAAQASRRSSGFKMKDDYMADITGKAIHGTAG